MWASVRVWPLSGHNIPLYVGLSINHLLYRSSPFLWLVMEPATPLFRDTGATLGTSPGKQRGDARALRAAARGQKQSAAVPGALGVHDSEAGPEDVHAALDAQQVPPAIALRASLSDLLSHY